MERGIRLRQSRPGQGGGVVTAVFVPTALGLLADAEEEAREKYRAWVDDGFWPRTPAQGVGLVELPRYTIGADTHDGVHFSYWYMSYAGDGHKYVASGRVPLRADVLALIKRELDGCTCGVTVDLLCPVDGDVRDTSMAVQL